jgi:methanogen homoaconitase small subunit
VEVFVLVEGSAFRLPNELWHDLNTDVIIPSAHLRVPESELPNFAFSGAILNFREQVAGCSILIGGANLGCGSSREQAPKALLGCGIKLILARSFGYIFYRNAINLGLALLVLDDDNLARIEHAEHIQADLGEGLLRVKGNEIRADPLNLVILRILRAGGLLQMLRADPRALD